MLGDKRGAHHDNAGEQGAGTFRVRLERVPFLGQVQSDAQILILRLRRGDKGLGQHGDAVLICGKRRNAFRMLGLPFNGHVRFRIDAVSGKDVVQGVFRRGTLAAGVNGLSGKVGDGLDAFAVLHDIEDAEGIDGKNLNLPFGVVIEDGRQVGGDSGDIRFALHQLRRDLVRGSRDGEGIGVSVYGPGFGAVHQLHHAHGRGPLERHDADGGIFGGGFCGFRFRGGGSGFGAFRRSPAAGRAAAGQQGRRQREGGDQRT